MATRITVTFVLLAALLGCGAPSSQHRPTLAAHQCGALGDVGGEVADIYAQQVVDVRPVYERKFIARAIQPRYLAGAELYVPARANVNEAYLERVLTCHAASRTASGSPNDPLGVVGVKTIDVDTVGPRYRISILGRDRATGEAIYGRARLLEAPAGQVTIQQLASAAHGPAEL